MVGLGYERESFSLSLTPMEVEGFPLFTLNQFRSI